MAISTILSVSFFLGCAGHYAIRLTVTSSSPPKSHARYVREFIELLGVPEERIVIHNGGIYKCESLLTCWRCHGISYTKDPDYINLIQQMILPKVPPSSGKRRLFISRNKGTKRRLKNEYDVEHLLQEWCFETVLSDKGPLALCT